jgi:hypothetical protein
MLPSDLKPEQFKNYPPEARKLATDYVAALQRLPLTFVASLLREVIDYDFKFPSRAQGDRKGTGEPELSLPGTDKRMVSGIRPDKFVGKLEKLDWINSPAQFVEQLSAHLWSTHQLDAFRKAAIDYANRLQAAVPPEPPAGAASRYCGHRPGRGCARRTSVSQTARPWRILQPGQSRAWRGDAAERSGRPSQSATCPPTLTGTSMAARRWPTILR